MYVCMYISAAVTFLAQPPNDNYYPLDSWSCSEVDGWRLKFHLMEIATAEMYGK